MVVPSPSGRAESREGPPKEDLDSHPILPLTCVASLSYLSFWLQFSYEKMKFWGKIFNVFPS